MARFGNTQKTHAHSNKNTRKHKKNTHTANNGGLSAKPIIKTMHKALKPQNKIKNAQIATNGGLSAKTIKKP